MIRDVHRYGSYLHLHSHAAQTAVSLRCLIRFAATVVITRVRKLSLTARLKLVHTKITAVPFGAAVFLLKGLKNGS